MPLRFVAERAVSPVGGGTSFVVVDENFAFHVEACAYLAYLRAGGRSPNTERVYAGRVAMFLSYCSAHGLDWREVSFDDLSRFLSSLATDPVPTVRNSAAKPRCRSHRTANAIMTAVCEFLRFASIRGWVAAAVAEQLSRPKFLRYRAPARTGERTSGFARSTRDRSSSVSPVLRCSR